MREYGKRGQFEGQQIKPMVVFGKKNKYFPDKSPRVLLGKSPDGSKFLLLVVSPTNRNRNSISSPDFSNSEIRFFQSNETHRRLVRQTIVVVVVVAAVDA